MSLTKQHLELMAQLQAMNRPPLPTPIQFLLAHGSAMQVRGKQPRRLGIPKACYWNAYNLARRRKRLRYVEGFALSLIPVEHAWCIDEDGRIVEPTWNHKSGFLSEPIPTDYFGMTFDLELVRRIRKLTKQLSMLWEFWHWREVYPILKAEMEEKAK